MPDFSDDLLRLIARQDGVVTRSQLVAGGVSGAAVRWNSGRAWRVLLPHVVILTREAPRPRQRLVAGLLWAGERSVLAGATAAAQHGITSADPRERVHLLVPAPLGSRGSGFAEVRRTLLHDDGIVTRGPIRLSSPARAAVDAARAAGSQDTRSAIFIEAVQRVAWHRLTTSRSGCTVFAPGMPPPCAFPWSTRHPARGRCPSASCSTSWRGLECSRRCGPTPPCGHRTVDCSSPPTPGSTTWRWP